ncbi:MAG: hypothetical protein C0592_11495 [Marinilabiliales bacterium]|nr:MAG: hypothetical protein C0592_11495 [Marinilabiliales bacterium]
MLVKLIKTSLIILLIGFLMISCESDDQLGLDIQPPSDLLDVEHIDTIPIIAFSDREDSVRTDETSRNLAGYYVDPVFGPVYAAFCSQIRLSEEDVTFGNNVIIDSLVLSLEYYDVYVNNKTNNRTTLSVYQLDDQLYIDSAYYSNMPFNTGRLLGSKTFVPAPEDSVPVGNDIKKPQVRITLDKNLAKDFVAAADMGYLSDNTTFEDFFHGICVVPSTNISGGSLISFDMLATTTCLTMYYRTDTDTLDYVFEINSACARYNYFNHYSFSGAEANYIAQMGGDTALGQDKLYLQPMAGSKIFIQFPGIEDMDILSTIVINKATLVIPVDESDFFEPIYERPVTLTLAKLDEEGELQFLPDQIYSESSFGGIYDEDLKAYTFSLTRYIQDLIIGNEENFGLYLMVSGSSVRGNRVILNGPGNLSSKMKLDIAYTIVN